MSRNARFVSPDMTGGSTRLDELVVAEEALACAVPVPLVRAFFAGGGSGVDSTDGGTGVVCAEGAGVGSVAAASAARFVPLAGDSEAGAGGEGGPRSLVQARCTWATDLARKGVAPSSEVRLAQGSGGKAKPPGTPTLKPQRCLRSRTWARTRPRST